MCSRGSASLTGRAVFLASNRRKHGLLVQAELRAEPAAHERPDDADVGERDLQRLGQTLTGSGRRPGSTPRRSAGADSHFATVECGSVGDVKLARRREDLLHHDVRLRKPASRRLRASSDPCLRWWISALGHAPWGARLERVLFDRDVRQHLVVHLDRRAPRPRPDTASRPPPPQPPHRGTGTGSTAAGRDRRTTAGWPTASRP